MSLFIIALVACLFAYYAFYLFKNSRDYAEMKYVSPEDLKKIQTFREVRAVSIWLFISVLVKLVTFYMSPMAVIVVIAYFFMFIKWPTYAKYYAGPVFNSDEIDSLKGFGLCLCSTTDYGKHDYKIEKAFCKKLKFIEPIYSIGSGNEIVPSIGAEKFYITDGEWTDSVTKAMDKTQLILIRPNSSEDCQFEMKQIAGRGYMTKSIFIIDSNESLNILNSYITGTEYDEIELDNIDSPIILFLSESGEQWYSFDYKNFIVERAINKYLEVHPDYSHCYESVLADRKNIIKRVFTEPMPSQLDCGKLGTINLFAYFDLNYWKMSMAALWFIYLLVVSYIGSFVCQLCNIPTLWTYFIILIFIIPLFIFGPRVSWFTYNWGSENLFISTAKFANRYALYSLAVSILMWCLTFVLVGFGS